jgi:hypothetical protein
MLLTVIFISVILVAMSFAGLGITMLVRKNGRFPQTEISGNRHMKNRGITCARQDEIRSYRQMVKSSGTDQESAQPPMRDCGLGCSCITDEF